jgi:ribulose-phosphate 3-epimerase
MDGHFVSNLSFGLQVVKAIRLFSRLFFDVHLMCSKPEILLELFAKAGADEMIIHIELGEQVPSLIGKIKSLGKKVGLASIPASADKNSSTKCSLKSDVNKMRKSLKEASSC